MRKIRFKKFVCLLLFLFFPAFAGDNVNTKWYQKKRIAFLVGVNHYEATTSLKYAAKDPEKLEPLLAEAGYFDKIVTLNDAGKMVTTLDKTTWKGKRSELDPNFQPDKKTIDGIFSELVAEKPDMLLFYFSGHGFISGDEGKNTIAPTDISLDENNQPLNGITLDSLSNQTDGLNQVVFLIDACRNPLPEKSQNPTAQNPTTQNPTAKNPKPKSNFQSFPKPKTFQLNPDFSEELPLEVETAKGIVILIGTAQNDYSLENEDLKGGAFTYFLRLGIRGEIGQDRPEEFTTTENVFEFTDKKLKEYYEDQSKLDPKTKKKAKDVYQITTERGFRGDFLITYGRPTFLDPNYEDNIKSNLSEDYSRYLYYDSGEDRNIFAKLRLGKNGNRRELRFIGRDERTKNYFPESLEGIYRLEYDLGSIPITSEDFSSYYATQYSSKNKAVFDFQMEKYSDVGWQYRGIYKQTEDDKKDEERQKIYYEKKIYDFMGNVLFQEYFDRNGNDITLGGVKTVQRAYDSHGQKTLEEFLDKDGKLHAPKGQNYARYAAVYVSKGNLLYEAWYGDDGELIENKNGIARIDYSYDKDWKLTSIKNWDKTGKPTGDKTGVAKTVFTYNDPCLKAKKERLLENVDYKRKEEAKNSWKLGGYKVCTETVIHTDKNDKPVSDPKHIHKELFTFDDKGNKTSEEYFRADGRRWTHYGVAKKVHEYDSDGNIIKTSNFGEYEVDGKPVPASDEFGVHAYTYSYDAHNRDCLKTRQKQGALYKEYDCADSIQHLGIDGKPIENTEGVTRVKVWYDGTKQEEALREYYGMGNRYIRSNEVSWFHIYDSSFNNILVLEYTYENGKETLKRKTVYEYDENGNKTLWAIFNVEDGKETLSDKVLYEYDEKSNRTSEAYYELKDGKEILSGKVLYKYKYDEKGNKTLDATYKLKEGKETLSSKSVYKYDEKGNKTLEATYKLKEGKETLSSKSVYKYDEKGNKTLEAKYSDKEGKETLDYK